MARMRVSVRPILSASLKVGITTINFMSTSCCDRYRFRNSSVLALFVSTKGSLFLCPYRQAHCGGRKREVFETQEQRRADRYSHWLGPQEQESHREMHNHRVAPIPNRDDDERQENKVIVNRELRDKGGCGSQPE